MTPKKIAIKLNSILTKNNYRGPYFIHTVSKNKEKTRNNILEEFSKEQWRGIYITTEKAKLFVNKLKKYNLKTSTQDIINIPSRKKDQSKKRSLIYLSTELNKRIISGKYQFILFDGIKEIFAFDKEDTVERFIDYLNSKVFEADLIVFYHCEKNELTDDQINILSHHCNDYLSD